MENGRRSDAGRKRTSDDNTNSGDGGSTTANAKKYTRNNNNHSNKRQEVGINSAMPQTPVGNNKRQQKKAGRRAAQLETMQKKADVEDAYFRQCQLEAAQEKKNKNNSRDSQAKVKAREAELFGTQGAQGINFSKYDEIKVEVKSSDGKNNNSVFHNFEELSLQSTIGRNVSLMNYEKPTPIQKHSIPVTLGGGDLMCCAQTGSGKTCAFLLPVCAKLVDKNDSFNSSNSNYTKISTGASTSCVVLAPTRELVSQIELEAQKLTYQVPGLQTVAVYGGASQRKQIRDLAFGADIIVATPGRLTDFCDRSLIDLSDVKFLILDEADRMLDMGFEPQIRKIVLQSGMTPKHKRQTLMFSATFPAKIQLLARAFLRENNYTWIAVGRVGSTNEGITQVIVRAPKSGDKRQKLNLVVEAIQKAPISDGRTLIFVQKKRTASWLKKMLEKGGPSTKSTDYNNNNHYSTQKGPGNNIVADVPPFESIAAVEIHGDRSQSQREAALAAFRSGKCRVLVATDVAARGLDIGGVEHVINMDLPFAADDFDSYVHRIGRTGRAGHTGLATSLYVPGDAPKIGNRKIASQLIRQLRESRQEVPRWLEEESPSAGNMTNNNNNTLKTQQSSSRPPNHQLFGGNNDRKSLDGRGRGHENGISGRGGRGRNRTNNQENGTTNARAGGGRGHSGGRGRGRGRGKRDQTG